MSSLVNFFDDTEEVNNENSTKYEIFINEQRNSFKSFNKVIYDQRKKKSSYEKILPEKVADAISAIQYYVIQHGNILLNILEFFLRNKKEIYVEKEKEEIVVEKEYENKKRKIDLYIKYKDKEYWVEVKTNNNHDSGKKENINSRLKKTPDHIDEYFVVYFFDKDSLSYFCTKFDIDAKDVKDMEEKIFSEEWKKQLSNNFTEYLQ